MYACLHCAYVCCSGSETGDVGGGAEETDEPPEQHRGEDRQVSSVRLGLIAHSFIRLNEIMIKDPCGFHWTVIILCSLPQF